MFEKMTKKLSVCLGVLVLNGLTLSAAQASDFGVALGLRMDSATSNTAGTSISSSNDFMGGVLGLIDITDPVQVRTGFFYASRQYGYTPATGSSGTASFSYMDLPLGILWKLSDYGGPFLGANFAFTVSSACPGTCTGVSNIPVGYQFGAQFKFAPQFGGALYYEAMSAVMTGIDNPKAFVLQLMMTF